MTLTGASAATAVPGSTVPDSGAGTVCRRLLAHTRPTLLHSTLATPWWRVVDEQCRESGGHWIETRSGVVTPGGALAMRPEARWFSGLEPAWLIHKLGSPNLIS